jgi:hypothetical protein
VQTANPWHKNWEHCQKRNRNLITGATIVALPSNSWGCTPHNEKLSLWGAGSSAGKKMIWGRLSQSSHLLMNKNMVAYAVLFKMSKKVLITFYLQRTDIVEPSWQATADRWRTYLVMNNCMAFFNSQCSTWNGILNSWCIKTQDQPLVAAIYCTHCSCLAQQVEGMLCSVVCAAAWSAVFCTCPLH